MSEKKIPTVLAAAYLNDARLADKQTGISFGLQELIVQLIARLHHAGLLDGKELVQAARLGLLEVVNDPDCFGSLPVEVCEIVAARVQDELATLRA